MRGRIIVMRDEPETILLDLRGQPPSVTDAAYTHVVQASVPLPIRAESLDYALVDKQDVSREAEERLLLELNRVLREGGGLIYITPIDEEEAKGRLLRSGFALREQLGERRAYDAVKSWRRYLGESCPRCGGVMIMTLRPSDSKVSKLWSLYCASCSYTWSVEDFILDI